MASIQLTRPRQEVTAFADQGLLMGLSAGLAALFATFGHGNSPESYRNQAVGDVLFKLGAVNFKASANSDFRNINDRGFNSVGAVKGAQVSSIFAEAYEQVTHVILRDSKGEVKFPIATTPEEKAKLQGDIEALRLDRPDLEFVDADNSGEINGPTAAAVGFKQKLGGGFEVTAQPARFLESRAWLKTVAALKGLLGSVDTQRNALIGNSPKTIHTGLLPIVLHPETGEACYLAHVKPANSIGGKDVLTTMSGNLAAGDLTDVDPLGKSLDKHMKGKFGVSLNDVEHSEKPVGVIHEYGLGNLGVFSLGMVTEFSTYSEPFLTLCNDKCHPDRGFDKGVAQGFVFIPIKNIPEFSVAPDKSGSLVGSAELEVYRPVFNVEKGAFEYEVVREQMNLRPQTVALLEQSAKDPKFVSQLLTLAGA